MRELRRAPAGRVRLPDMRSPSVDTLEASIRRPSSDNGRTEPALAEVFPAMKSGRGLPAGRTVPRLARESGAGPPQAFTGTPSVSGTPLEGRLPSEAAAGPVIVPGARPGIVNAWCAGCGRGPRKDPPVAAEHPARHPRVRARVLQGPHCTGADADHVVTVPDRIPGGLDPNGGVGYQNCLNAGAGAFVHIACAFG